MFKKLDKLILKAFVGPFIATFFITLMVLVMQFFWLYIDDFVGKGLGAGEILKFIFYQSAVLVPLALPLAILLSSLMTFGNLGESFELVAIKSSGISLLRFMRPLFFLSIVLSVLAFLFSNFVIPVAWLKSRSMLQQIVHANPAFDLKEGVFFSRIPNFVLKVGTKEPNDSIVRDVVIYEQNQTLQDNFIIAKSAVMSVSPDKKYLEFNLKDGTRYQERGMNSYAGGPVNTDYIRLGFDQYKKQFDLSSLILNLNDSGQVSTERVFSMRQLNVAIDSLAKDFARSEKKLDRDIYKPLAFDMYLDTSAKKMAVPDSMFTAATKVDLIIPDSAKEIVHQRALSQINTLSTALANNTTIVKDKGRVYRKHKIEWHRKLVLSAACLILFLIGAPLGSIIRKGGLGTPLIAAISFFMVFYFATTMGEKFAKEDTLSAFAGMWLAAFILVPVGLFLTYKAMRDSQIFNKDKYALFFKKLAAFFKIRRGANKATA